MKAGGRPLKDGLDFIRLDVYMDSDDKVALIEMDVGDAAFGVLIKLLMQIYSRGYFSAWTEREEMLFCRSRRVNPALCRPRGDP